MAISWEKASQNYKSNRFAKTLDQAATVRNKLRDIGDDRWKTVQKDINKAFSTEKITRSIPTRTMKTTSRVEVDDNSDNNVFSSLIQTSKDISTKAKNITKDLKNNIHQTIKSAWKNSGIKMHERVFVEDILNNYLGLDLNKKIDESDFTKKELSDISELGNNVATYRDSLQYEDYTKDSNNIGRMDTYAKNRENPMYQIRNLIGRGQLKYENGNVMLHDNYDWEKLTDERLNSIFGTKTARFLRGLANKFTKSRPVEIALNVRK